MLRINSRTGLPIVALKKKARQRQKSFLIEGSETPQSIPWWVWTLIIGFAGWALFYFIRYFSIG